MKSMIKCSECPRCEDRYPDKTDFFGNHFCICGMTGNMVYTKPRKERKYNGRGWIEFSESSCGLFSSFNEAFNKMSEPEKRRWREKHGRYEQMTLMDWMGENGR